MISNLLYEDCEDSLTKGVFSHLLHLPTDCFWQILCEACHSELPTAPGELELVDRWPKWDATESDNANYVEPDLFLRFAKLDLIIEAKRRDVNQQNEAQWKDQVRSYANEHEGGAGRELRLIAVGGLRTFGRKTIVVPYPSPGTKSVAAGQTITLTCVVHMCQWAEILQECQRLDTELEREPTLSEQDRAHRRILRDLIEFFAARGYPTGRWLGEIAGTLPRLSASMAGHHRTFQKLSSEIAL